MAFNNLNLKEGLKIGVRGYSIVKIEAGNVGSYGDDLKRRNGGNGGGNGHFETPSGTKFVGVATGGAVDIFLKSGVKISVGDMDETSGKEPGVYVYSEKTKFTAVGVRHNLGSVSILYCGPIKGGNETGTLEEQFERLQK